MDHRPLLTKITAPTLVIAGRHDPATTLEAGEYIAQHIPGARLAVLEAAHIANIEQPQVYAERCWNFCWTNKRGVIARARRPQSKPRLISPAARNSCGVVPVCLRKNRAKCEGSENASSCGDLLDRLGGEYQLALGFGEHALADEMTGGDAGRALDVIVEPIDRHAEFFGIEAELMLAAEKFVDQRPQVARRWRRPAARSRCRCGRGSRQAAPRRPRSAPTGRASPPDSPRAPGCSPRTARVHSAESRARSASSPMGMIGCAASTRSRDSASPAAIGKRDGCVLGEGQHPAFGDVRLETEAMGDRRRNENGGGRGERQPRRFKRHFAAAALDQKNLKQIAMPMRANGPVVDGGARGDRLDMDKVKRLIVRRIAVEMEQRQRTGHAPSISRSRRK